MSCSLPHGLPLHYDNIIIQSLIGFSITTFFKTITTIIIRIIMVHYIIEIWDIIDCIHNNIIVLGINLIIIA